MGSCLGRLLSDSDDTDTAQAPTSSDSSSTATAPASYNHQYQTQQEHSRRQRRSQRSRGGLLPGLSLFGRDDDDVPLLSGDAGSNGESSNSSSSSRPHRHRRHHRRSNSATHNQAATSHLQYFTSSPISGGGFGPASSSTESNAELRLAQRVGLIQQLPLIRYDEEQKQLARECVICMIEFETGDMLRCLPCMHQYHEDCIDKWLLKSLTCPSCLEPVDAALLATFATGWN